MESGRLVATDAQGMRYLAPTDVAQFIRLEQCRRYLRLRLHERAVGSRFMRDYGVVPQSIPPLLTHAGVTFEQAVAARFQTLNCATGAAGQGPRADDNERVVALARALAPGEILVPFQPRLHATVSGWQMRGDVDILRLERDDGAQLHALIADMKSSTATKVEHRLQVAVYHVMLATLLEEKGAMIAVSRQRSAVSLAVGRLAGDSRWPTRFSPAMGPSAGS